MKNKFRHKYSSALRGNSLLPIGCPPTFQQSILPGQRAPSIHAAGCCYSSASRHPGVLTSCLCLRLELLAGQQTSLPGGADEISITYLISSHHHHPPIPPLAFRGVWCHWPLLCCPSLHAGREEERGRLQPTTTMSQEAPCLSAPPAAQYSCGSVPDPDQLGSNPCRRAT